MSTERMHIRWNLIITALCLGLLFCMADAYLDGVIYAERGFFSQLFYPVEQELIYRIQTFLFICLFAGYAWHQSNAQERLKVSLEEAMAAFKSERARAESVLAAIETSMDGIAILNGAEEYIYLNESHAAIYGYESPSELIGKSWHALYNEQERERLQPLIYEGFAARRGWRGVATGLKKDGSEFPQEISLSLLDDGGLICVVRDISKRKSREEAIRLLNENLQQQALDLQATNRELEAFSYSLSHDLRSPLTRIYMSAQALEDMYGEGFDETGKRLLHLICTGCESMEAFIGAMLVLFRVTRSEISCCEVDLSALAGEIMAEIRLQQADRQIEWVTAPGLVAWCDPQLMRILLENLLQNAWKFSTCTEHACIEFGSSESDGVRAFFVCDNGAGFSMTEVERLFKPFQRLHCSNDIPGTGIGLATVQRIVERHGGRVWGEGIVDGGATFYFTLGRSELLESEPGAKEN